MPFTRFLSCLQAFAIGLSLCLFSTGLPAQSLSAQRAPDSVADLRLKRPVTLDGVGIPLKDLLQRLSAKDLALSCDRECAEQKLQLRLKNHPVGEIMQALADMLLGSWQAVEENKVPKGYKLVLKTSAISERNRWWQLFLQAQRESLEPTIKALVTSMRSGPINEVVPDDTRNNPAFVSAADHKAFYNSLPADLQQTLAERIDDITLYQPGGLAYDDMENAYVIKVSELPEKAQAVLRKHSPHPLPEDSYAYFTNDGTDVQANFIDSKGKDLLGTLLVMAHNISSLPLIGLDQSPLGRMARENQLGSAPVLWRQLAAYQNRTVWKNKLPTLTQMRFPSLRRSDLLHYTAESAAFDFIADYYSLPSVPMPPDLHPQPLEKPLEDTLNQYAAEYDMSWKQQKSGLYLFRNNRWYRDDRLEVPGSLGKWLIARQESNQKLAQEAKTSPSQRLRWELVWQSALASNLSRWQLISGLKWLARDEGKENAANGVANNQQTSPFSALSPASSAQGSELYPFESITDVVNREYPLLRFYAALTEEQQQALCEQQLPLSALSAVQQQQAIALCPLLRIHMDNQKQIPVVLGIRNNNHINGKLQLVVTRLDRAN
jgi:hypothetical protein